VGRRTQRARIVNALTDYQRRFSEAGPGQMTHLKSNACLYMLNILSVGAKEMLPSSSTGRPGGPREGRAVV
jgi:hypothetical protein